MKILKNRNIWVHPKDGHGTVRPNSHFRVGRDVRKIPRGGGLVLSRIRILPTVTALILTFAVLFGGFQFYRTYALIRPLELSLQQVPFVQSATVVTSGASPQVDVSLGRVKDLQTTYDQIERRMTAVLGGPATVALTDRRTPQLTSVYESLAPILYQGMAHGDYETMIANFTKAARARGVAARVTMNVNDVFVQLETSAGYLYDVISTKAVGVSGQ